MKQTLTDYFLTQANNGDISPDEAERQIKELIGVFAGFILIQTDKNEIAFDILGDLDFNIRVNFKKIIKQ